MSADFLEKDLVYVNSANRLQGDSHNFTINLSNQIRVPNNYDSASVLALSCPKSYYLFSSSNNTFVVNENGALTTITIPIGNYSFSSLTNALVTLLAACAWDYAVDNVTRTGHFLFTVSGNGGLQPSFNFSSNTIGAIVGFDEASYAFTANTLESVNIVNLQTTSTIELSCDFVRNSVLSVIIPNNTDFSIINYNEYNVQYASQPLTKTNFSSASFVLLDGRTGSPLDLNGLDFNFTMVLYKKNNFYQHMLNDKAQELELEALREEVRSLLQPSN